ncbi:ADP-ribosylglycohydrolase family protein [Streptomyces sp. NPDC055078]
MTTELRLTWVQPEDLVGHELRQASEDGRRARAIATRWREAGGPPPPRTAGASPAPASPALRTLATALLDELAALPSPLTRLEPTDLAAIKALCPAWPTPPAPSGHRAHTPGVTHDAAVRRRAGAPGPYGGAAPGGPESSWAPRGVPPPAPGGPPDPGGTGTRSTRGTEPPGRYGGHGPAAGGVSDAGSRPAGGPEDRPSGSTGDRPSANPGDRPSANPGDPLPRLTAEALHAAWLGRAVGCLLGKPVEKLPLHAIRSIARATGNWPLHTWFTARGLPEELRRAHPWNRRSAPTSLAENIDGMPEDDDLNYPLVNLLLLQRYGRDFRTSDVARLWLDQLPAGRTFTAERVAYRNLLCGIEPPLTARHHNPFREWIGAAIRADMHGWTHPGDPAAAAVRAHRDASLTHTANGVHSAMFIAAAIASAAGGSGDVHRALATGLSVVPPGGRLASAVRHGIETARAERDFATVVDLLHTAYGHYHWVHAVPNAALLAAALTHADGDFSGSVCRAVSGGWDTDSNGATAGSIAGLLAGSPDAVPDRWTTPLKNRLATSVADFDGVGFDTLARLTHQEALRP